ncbi:orotate phosphoribosyltransferase [Thermogymnomonas acidicola]|uniref:Orotate phosphoribosyltransferase n=1 Tax=Thermogymnomonas acidicola TaxID=399579 RepID=A0AA37BPS8_9ARCH|nr:orotate phosphoribosyltransferase [Thermogymnomonas acidicola]GGM67180.1 orotate phosphoribosyltransferase [Thermogymnomonas acidicola]
MLSDVLIRAGAIKFGDFVLTSGKRSNYYVDIKDACTDPSVLREITEGMKPHVRGVAVAGVELGAVPLVVSTSLSLGLRYIIIRKERNHGTKKLIVGNVERGAEVTVLEDVVTTGNSVMRAVNMLREEGATVRRVVCVVDREEGGSQLLCNNGVELISLVKARDFLGAKGSSDILGKPL